MTNVVQLKRPEPRLELIPVPGRPGVFKYGESYRFAQFDEPCTYKPEQDNFRVPWHSHRGGK